MNYHFSSQPILITRNSAVFFMVLSSQMENNSNWFYQHFYGHCAPGPLHTRLWLRQWGTKGPGEKWASNVQARGPISLVHIEYFYGAALRREQHLELRVVEESLPAYNSVIHVLWIDIVSIRLDRRRTVLYVSFWNMMSYVRSYQMQRSLFF